VRLGRVACNAISPSLFGLVERGARKRPELARRVRGLVEIRFKESFAPVRLSFADDGILVEDAAGGNRDARPDLVISGSLPDIVQFASAPLAGGIPKLTDARGRAALMRVAKGSVRMEGSPRLAQRLLKLLEL
jgi:hypothetical protein